MPTKQQRAIDNLINGNLTDARKLSKGVSFSLLAYTAEHEFGMTKTKSLSAAAYLTCRENDPSRGERFQAYCDAS